MSATPHHNDRILSWERFYCDCRQLAAQLKEMGRWEQIVAITRGGLIPAAIIAKILDVRLIDTICIASYSEKTKSKLTIVKNVAIQKTREPTTLVVDDLVDTGETIKAVKILYPQAHYATVYVKPVAQKLVDSFAVEVTQEEWIVFPWDTN